jgi:L-fuconolactonase
LTTVVDSHQHFWSRSRGDYTWLTEDLGPIYRDFGPDDLRPLIHSAGVDKTIIVQAAATIAETRFMLEIADKTDFVAGVVGWVDFEAPDVAAHISDLAGHPKLKGFRPMIQDIEDDDWMLRSDIEPAFGAIIDHGLTFDALVFPRHLNNLKTLLSRFPEMKTVIDHGAKAQIGKDEYEPWASDMAELAQNTAAYCKISGLITEDGPDWSEERLKPYCAHLISTFGPTRLMWGSDWPVVNLVGYYGSWIETTRTLFANLPIHQQDAIFGANAVQFYELDG